MFYLQHRPGFALSNSSMAVSSSHSVAESEDDGTGKGDRGQWGRGMGGGCSSHADAGCCGSTPRLLTGF